MKANVSLPAARAMRCLIEWRGRPAAIRCRNGPEYISRGLEVMDSGLADALANRRRQRVLQPFEGRERVLQPVYPPLRQASPKLKVLAEALLAGTS